MNTLKIMSSNLNQFLLVLNWHCGLPQHFTIHCALHDVGQIQIDVTWSLKRLLNISLHSLWIRYICRSSPTCPITNHIYKEAAIGSLKGPSRQYKLPLENIFVLEVCWHRPHSTISSCHGLLVQVPCSKELCIWGLFCAFFNPIIPSVPTDQCPTVMGPN